MSQCQICIRSKFFGQMCAVQFNSVQFYRCSFIVLFQTGLEEILKMIDLKLLNFVVVVIFLYFVGDVIKEVFSWVGPPRSGKDDCRMLSFVTSSKLFISAGFRRYCCQNGIFYTKVHGSRSKTTRLHPILSNSFRKRVEYLKMAMINENRFFLLQE